MDLTGLIRKESLDTIKKVLSKTEIPVDHQWLDYEVLNTALEYGRKDVAEFLLTGNCRVNKTTILSLPFDTPLHNAVKMGDLKVVGELLARGASITVWNMENNTPLHLAFILNQESIIDLILDAIAQIKDFSNSKNKYGLSHMHIACARNKIDVIQGYLGTANNIKDTVHVDSLLWPGFTPMHFAAQFKSLDALKVIMKHSSKLDIARPDAKGQTPQQIISARVEDDYLMLDMLRAEYSNSAQTSSYKLPSNFHLVCAGNDPEALIRLIEKGAPINASVSVDATILAGYTPLHFAVMSDNEKNVDVLLQHGADMDRVTKEKATALHLALYKDKPNGKSKKNIIDLLYSSVKEKLNDHEDDNGLSYFHIACTRNDIDTVKNYLDQGKDMHSQICSGGPFDGYYPIHFAVLYNCVEVVQLLIERGVDVNVFDEGRDGTPLHMAFFFCYKDIANLLLKNGADATATRSDESTMLHVLVSRYAHKGDDELLPFIKRLIFEFGVDVNAKDSKGYTALHHACKKYKTGFGCVEILIEAGANVNLENKKGETAFELAMSPCNQDNKTADYTILYDHVQNLKALNLEINPKNEKCCEVITKMKIKQFDGEKVSSDIKELTEKHQKRVNEVKKLKKASLNKVVDGLTLYDLLRMEPKDAVTHLKCENLRKLFDQNDFQACFPIYKYMIRLMVLWCDAQSKNIDDAEPVVKRPRSE